MSENPYQELIKIVQNLIHVIEEENRIMRERGNHASDFYCRKKQSLLYEYQEHLNSFHKDQKAVGERFENDREDLRLLVNHLNKVAHSNQALIAGKLKAHEKFLSFFTDELVDTPAPTYTKSGELITPAIFSENASVAINEKL